MCHFKSLLIYQDKIYSFAGIDSHAQIANQMRDVFFRDISSGTQIEDSSIKIEILFNKNIIKFDNIPTSLVMNFKTTDISMIENLKSFYTTDIVKWLNDNRQNIIDEIMSRDIDEMDKQIIGTKQRHGYKNMDKYRQILERIYAEFNYRDTNYNNFIKTYEKSLLTKVKNNRMKIDKAISALEKYTAKKRAIKDKAKKDFVIRLMKDNNIKDRYIEPKNGYPLYHTKIKHRLDRIIRNISRPINIYESKLLTDKIINDDFGKYTVQ